MLESKIDELLAAEANLVAKEAMILQLEAVKQELTTLNGDLKNELDEGRVESKALETRLKNVMADLENTVIEKEVAQENLSSMKTDLAEGEKKVMEVESSLDKALADL